MGSYIVRCDVGGDIVAMGWACRLSVINEAVRSYTTYLVSAGDMADLSQER